jgi:hypothetical protein
MGSVEKIVILSKTHKIFVDGTDVGYAKGALTLEVTTEVAPIEVDQVPAPLYHVPTKQTVKITVNLAEATLENLKQAWNLPAAIETVPGGRRLKAGIPSFIPIHSVIFEGEFFQPDGTVRYRKITFPKVQFYGAPSATFKVGEITVLTVEMYVLPDVTKPAGEEFFVIEET